MSGNTLQRLSDKVWARWTALIIVSLTMMFAHFFSDVMSPLEPMLTAALGSEDGMGMGWTSSEYGWFSGTYGLMNVYLLLLFFGGIILDRFGIRFTGLTSTILMFLGAIIKWYAVANVSDGTVWVPFGGEVKTQVALAGLGFAIFGVGAEIAGITVSKVIVKWFSGKEVALAMGVQVAFSRIGTAIALGVSLPIARYYGGVSTAVALGAASLCIAIIAIIVYNFMDRKEDKAAAKVCDTEEDGFRFADLKILFTNKGFWYITVLCLMFYAGVFPFLKFATKLMVFKYGVSQELAGLIPAMLPFGTIFLTPFFGSIYDRHGKGATLMIIGSVLLTAVHLVFALPVSNIVLAVSAMIVLGIAFGLVPSAMWPSVPKIIPMKLLGTAYAVIFYIQNIGLSMVPIWIGIVNERNTNQEGSIDYTETMTIFAGFGIVAIIIAYLLLFEDRRKGYGLEKANIQTQASTGE